MKRLLLALASTTLFAGSTWAQDLALPRALAEAETIAADSRAFRNFRVVEPGLYRSAELGRDDYRRLKELGIQTILSLQISAEDERERAKPYGIEVAHVAMAGLWTPTFAQMDLALEVLTTSPRPLLVHCTHGQDRTGFVVASYRVAVEGMPVAKAVAEAREAGCCFIMFEDLSEFLERYSVYRRARYPGTSAVTAVN